MRQADMTPVAFAALRSERAAAAGVWTVRDSVPHSSFRRQQPTSPLLKGTDPPSRVSNRVRDDDGGRAGSRGFRPGDQKFFAPLEALEFEPQRLVVFVQSRDGLRGLLLSLQQPVDLPREIPKRSCPAQGSADGERQG